jgi:hypothetical protein
MNILPTKHIEEKDTLLYSGALILKELSKPQTVSELWYKTKKSDSIDTFERFVATLDMLYIIGLVELEANKITKVIR